MSDSDAFYERQWDINLVSKLMTLISLQRELTISLQRELAKTFKDLRLAEHWLDLANGDAFLAARWVILEVPIEDARRCVALGLEPEQLTRRVEMDGEEVLVAQLMSELSDEALLKTIAEAGEPLPHINGRWLFVEGGTWWCSECGTAVRKDPRKHSQDQQS